MDGVILLRTVSLLLRTLMASRLTRTTRLVTAAGVVFGLAGNVMATCVEDGQVPQTSMACCAAGHMTCGEHMEAMDCCRSQNSSARSENLAGPPQKAKDLLIQSVEATPITSVQALPLSGASTHLHHTSPPSPIHAPPLFVVHHAFLI